MATGKSCSRWFAPLAALLMVVSLSGCFDKEGDQRKAFIDFLQNTVMRSGERLPTLTADQKKQFGPFVSDYAILYGYSQQVNQAMDSGLRPVVDSVNAIRVPQDYVTQSGPLREMNGSLGVLAQQLQNADPRDAWAFVERICGVCTGVHALASVYAIEDAIGIKVPDNANIIRNIMLATLWCHDHLV